MKIKIIIQRITLKDFYIKQSLVFLAIISVFLLWTSSTLAATKDETGTESGPDPEAIDFHEVTAFWDDLVTKYQGFLPETEKLAFQDFLTGKNQFNPLTWVSGLLKYALQELISNSKLLGMLIMLTIFSALLQTLQTAFEKATVSKVANAVVVMMLFMLVINSFHLVMSSVNETIGTMIDFLMAMIPVLLALISTSGGMMSASFFHPVLLFMINTTGVLIQYVVLPLLLMSTILSIVSSLSDQFKLTQLADLLRSVAIWMIGIFMTVFLTLISIQGISTAVADGIGLKTAKFVSSNFVPVVGRMLTDAADTVVNASVLLKNTVGIAGLVVIFIMIIFPAIKILVIALFYRLACVLLQPLANSEMMKCLNIVGKNLFYVFGAFMIVGVMFFLAITIVITAGNITMMVR